MEKKPCTCCKDGKPGHTGGSDGYGYNRLEGEARDWAASNRFTRSEFCVPVKSGNKFGGADWQKQKCGDGRMGFSSRRRNQNKVKIEKGLDGQFKRKRSTLINKRSARAVVSRRARRIDGSKVGLISSIQIIEAMRDPVKVTEQRRGFKKMKRAQNRNSRSRRGLKRTIKLDM